MGVVPEEYDFDSIGTAPTCQACGSEHVSKDAWACWNPATGFWELETVFDHEYCHRCEAETSFVWRRVEQVPSRRVRDLNDAFRRDGKGNGTVLVSPGIEALGSDMMSEILAAVRDFSAFSDDNDPWGEHDFGRVEVRGQPIFWKIDYYNPSLTAGSDNPGNAGETHRVLTIMLPNEY